MMQGLKEITMEKVVKRKELMIETGNQIGVMAMIAALMAENGVNIDSFCAYNCGDNAKVNLLTSDNEKARRALEGRGYKIEEREVVILVLWNRPGALSKVAGKIRDSGINIQSIYGTASPDGVRNTIVILSEDNAKTSAIFDDIVIADAEDLG
jgi:hypothetical protein